MTENQSATAVQEKETFDYPIRIEDSGPATKRVTIDIPQERIAAKMAEQYKELRSQAAIPGFRPGHAPQKLIEKRFSTEIKDQLRGALIRASHEQAIEE